MRKWLCEFGRSISLSESTRREATECLPCSIARGRDDRCGVGTALSWQKTCKFGCKLWIVMLMASVWLIEYLKQLSSFQSVTLIAAGFCYFRTVLNAQRKKVRKNICLSKLQSFRRIRQVVEALIASSCLSVCQSANLKNWNDYHPNSCWQ
jgi:hypothetical protein